MLAAAVVASCAATRPHIVYMLADNIGWGGVGFLRAESPAGPSPDVNTPNIDGLARDGVRLDRFYAYKMCSPSRSSFLSGRLPVHVNILNSVQESPGAGIPLGMTTMADKLKGAGYRTHQVGKWHVGYASKKNLPVSRGFETSLGYLHAYNGYLHGWGKLQCPQFPGPVKYTPNSTDGQQCTEASVEARKLQYSTDLWLSHGPAYGINGTQFEEFVFRDHALSIIREHNSSEPLFLFYAMHTLHSPLCAPLDYLAKFSHVDNEDRKHVAAMTLLMDDVVGDVVAGLKSANLWSNTVFIWTSDNGAAIEQVTGAKSAYPLKGGYYTNWEGGVRAPGLVAGGAVPAGGRKVTGLFHIADWYATFCEIAGVGSGDPSAVAAGLPDTDSLSQLDVILGRNETSPRTEIYMTPLHGDTSITGGDAAYIAGEFKLIVNKVYQAGWCGPVYPNNSVPWNTWRSVEHCTTGEKKGCLFNIYQDPTEHHDLALQMPGKVDELYQKLVDGQKHFFDPDRGTPDTEAACAATARNGGYYGPWLD